MQIALTKKLAEAMGLKPAPANTTADPLFSWTANWAKVWDNRRAEDMLVLVNNATRFTVAVYQVKRKDMKKVGADMMLAAIRRTMLALNLNAEIVDEYLKLAGEVEFSMPIDRQVTQWANAAARQTQRFVGRKYNNTPQVFDDTVGTYASEYTIGYGTASAYKPCDAFFTALSKLTGKPLYNYRAFELLVTLDLEIYEATRRLIVPADITFAKLHSVLQKVFHWKNYHMHDFVVCGDRYEPIETLVMSRESLEYAPDAILESERVLSDYFLQYKRVVYTYDMGDNWEHVIELVRVIDRRDCDSPYLLEAVGQTPPEDVGGVGGFVDFREIMLDPAHEDYAEMKEWAGYWKPELAEYEARARVVRG